MTKDELLLALQVGHLVLDGTLAQAGEERMTVPGAQGDWTIKDIMAHILWYEREMAHLLQTRALAGSDLWNLPLDERNALIFTQNHARPLQEVMAEARQVYAQLLEQAQTLSDDELNDPRRFQAMPDDWVPWQILADNTWAHEREHAASIRAWLEQGQPTPKLDA